MRSTAGRMIVVVYMAVLALPAAAQQQGVPGPAQRREERPSDQQREEVRKKMEVIRMARLTEALKLDEKTAAKFIPAITSLDQKRRTLLMENHETLREMRGLLAAQPPDTGKLKAAINRIEKNQREILSLRNKEFAAIRENLTVEQQARYLLFHQEFQREMRGLVEEAARSGGRGAASGQGRGQMHGAPSGGK